MTEISEDEDIYIRIGKQIKNIETSYLFYLSEAKQHKLNVLKAAQKYLLTEISQDRFISIIDKNRKYTDSLGKSTTEKLIQEALRMRPDPSRIKEGYEKGSTDYKPST